MVNQNTIICFDLETDGVNTESCNVWQIGCVPIDPRTLEILYEEKFESYIKPNDIADWEEYRVNTIGASNVNHITMAQLQAAPGEAEVFNKLAAYTKQYGSGKKTPISLGFNNVRFDNPIIERFAKKYKHIKNGKSSIFSSFFTLDLAHLCFNWFENLQDGPINYKLDTLRDYFSITKEGSHEAVKDVYDTAEIYVRFLKLQRMIVSGYECKKCNAVRKVNFRNAFKNK